MYLAGDTVISDGACTTAHAPGVSAHWVCFYRLRQLRHRNAGLVDATLNHCCPRHG